MLFGRPCAPACTSPPLTATSQQKKAGYIVDNCEAQVLITSTYMADTAKEVVPYAPNCHSHLIIRSDGEPEVEGFDDYYTALATQPAEPLAEQPMGSFMLYSSGTTSQPKGIKRELPAWSVDDETVGTGVLQQMLWGFDENTVYLSPAPLYHSAPSAFSTTALALGGTVVVMPRFDPVQALESIQKYKVTHSQWVPTMFTRMLKMAESERSGFDLSSHRVAIHAAAPCPIEVKRQMFDWWGNILYEYYAGTEANGFAHAGPQEWLANPGTVGKALAGTLRICNEEGEELPPGETGLVYFEQEVMGFRYHKDDAKTKEVQHPEHPNWTALGDVGYLNEDGYLFLTDRATFMIISGGVNIYPQEIEDALVMHPKVADVAVIGVPNEEMGEEVKAIVQVAEGEAGSDELSAELLAYAREHIAHYKCPRSVDFIAEMPRLPTGKLYKRILKDEYWGKGASKIV